jgi:two-component system sensor histidine kinase KdpD
MFTPRVGLAPPTGRVRPMIYPVALALVAVAATTAAIAAVNQFVDLGSVGIIYLVPVLFAALRLGLVPALIAATTSVAASAFFFYPPIYDFRVHSWEQLVDLVLFSVVAVVTSQLATSRKRHAEIAEMRAKTDELREALIGSVSHELRTPLASILGAASIIVAAPAIAGDKRLAALATMMREEAERLNDDIQNLLDATRISSEGIHPNLDTIDPADIVNVAVERQRARLAGHRTEIEVADDLPFVRGDAVLIDQALGQILDNAAKYSPAGSTIRIAAARADDGVVISATDQGAGISSAERPRLMQRFYRGERLGAITTGSGLGLWIAQAFVAACGGRIEVESEGIGRGAKVSILLPALPAVAQDIGSDVDG